MWPLFKVAQLVKNENDFVKRIKTAAGWAIDAKAEENNTFSFIQACIGLESIFGDNLKEMPLTLSLSDRCS